MAVSAWVPAVGATLGAAIGVFGAFWAQAKTWKRQQRTRWDKLTLQTYAAFLQEASAAYDAAILIARSEHSPPRECIDQFKTHYSAIAEHYENLILLAPSSHEQAERMMWTLWNVGEQTLPQSRDEPLATRTYRDARYHLRVAAQKQFKLHVPGPDLPNECSEHESVLARPSVSSPWHIRKMTPQMPARPPGVGA
jgi:hypothetical protein